MKVIIDEYIDKIENFSDLPLTKQTKFLAYCYVKNMGDELFTPKNINTFFELGNLQKPRNINDIFKKLSDGKPPIFLKRGKNYTFHRTSFKEIEGILNNDQKEEIRKGGDTSFKNLFAERLIRKMGKAFSIEIRDLHLVFGKSGTCTAFMLRKILEKMIFLTFAKNNKLQIIERDRRIIGLESMIDESMRNKINGIFILMPQTGKNLKGIKFLGDSAAHNPITNVEMTTLIPQMPFIITAYEELSDKL